MTLASAHHKPWFGGRSIVVLDDERSDLAKARLCNVPGVPVGSLGADVLANMRSQVLQYGAASIEQVTAQAVTKTEDGWRVLSACGQGWGARELVLATGYKRWEIEGLPCRPAPHPRGGKPDRIMLGHDGAYKVDDSLHVAGLLGGGSSQFAIAAGIGAQVADEILSAWAGKRTHVHDVPEAPR